MNQAALHRLLASKELRKPESADQKELFNLRLNTNISLIQHLFFSLYPEKKYTASFKKLLDLLPKLFDKRPENILISDLERLAY